MKIFSSARVGCVCFFLLTTFLIPGRGDEVQSLENVIAVDSPAFSFSPANWAAEADSGGRATWCPGAYLRVAWSTSSANPAAELILDVASYGEGATPPLLAYCVDGVWASNVPCAGRVPIQNLKGAGPHLLTVFVQSSQQAKRWGSGQEKGVNQVRVKGLAVDPQASAGSAPQATKWAWIVGDSITEGIQAGPKGDDNLACWSYFVGQSLESLGYEYGVSACGFSGWLRPGDASGDVPAFYSVSGGQYDDRRSRWNKINAQASLLDSDGKLSGYGKTGQEPAVVIINLGTNDGLNKVSVDDLGQSIAGGLNAIRAAAPHAKIFVLIPFGRFEANALQTAVKEANLHDADSSAISLIDLGENVSRALTASKFWGGLHPDMRGHANISALILARILPELPKSSDEKSP